LTYGNASNYKGSAKETIAIVKRKHTEWKKNLCQLFNRQGIDIQLYKSSKNNKRTNNSNRQIKQFSKEELKMTISTFLSLKRNAN
jgi:hypothetical protein